MGSAISISGIIWWLPATNGDGKAPGIEPGAPPNTNLISSPVTLVTQISGLFSKLWGGGGAMEGLGVVEGVNGKDT